MLTFHTSYAQNYYIYCNCISNHRQNVLIHIVLTYEVFFRCSLYMKLGLKQLNMVFLIVRLIGIRL